MKLEVLDAGFGYDKRHVVLEHVGFTVESGEICCVLGPNGVGKSTVFKTVLGLLPLISGSILIDGEDISGWSPAKMAANVAYVSQSHVPPFPYRVRDVVMLGRVSRIGTAGVPSREDRRVVETAMSDMGIGWMADRPYTEVSGGELQLVMIARALAQEPKLLVLDEPTAALDYGNVVRVIGKVRDLAQAGYAVVMTTHSPDHAFMCKSNVVLLQHGRPARFGSAKDIVTERSMREAYEVKVKIVEFENAKHEAVRLCSPML